MSKQKYCKRWLLFLWAGRGFKPLVVAVCIEGCTGFTQLPLLSSSFFNIKMEIQHAGTGEAAGRFGIALRSQCAKHRWAALCALVPATRPSSLPDQSQHLFFPLRKSWQNAVLHPCSPFTDSDPVQASQSSVPLMWVAWSLRTASCLGGTLEAEYIKRIS